MMEEEYLDVLDGSGQPVGRIVPRSNEVLYDGEYVRVVHVFLHNDQGLFLIQKRSLLKNHYPGMWDITGGAVSAGEDSKTAALREVAEEMGIDLPAPSLCLIASILRGHMLIDVWTARTNATRLVLQAEEVDDAKWVTGEALLALLFDSGIATGDAAYRKLIADFITNME